MADAERQTQGGCSPDDGWRVIQLHRGGRHSVYRSRLLCGETEISTCYCFRLLKETDYKRNKIKDYE